MFNVTFLRIRRCLLRRRLWTRPIIRWKWRWTPLFRLCFLILSAILILPCAYLASKTPHLSPSESKGTTITRFSRRMKGMSMWTASSRVSILNNQRTLPYKYNSNNSIPRTNSDSWDRKKCCSRWQAVSRISWMFAPTSPLFRDTTTLASSQSTGSSTILRCPFNCKWKL